MNNNTNDINWVLRWDHHPTKSVYFTKKYSGGNPHILMWGVGFQGLDDPPPKLQIPNTSLGNWEVDLNNEDSSYIIGIDFDSLTAGRGYQPKIFSFASQSDFGNSLGKLDHDETTSL